MKKHKSFRFLPLLAIFPLIISCSANSAREIDRVTYKMMADWILKGFEEEGQNINSFKSSSEGISEDSSLEYYEKSFGTTEFDKEAYYYKNTSNTTRKYNDNGTIQTYTEEYIYQMYDDGENYVIYRSLNGEVLEHTKYDKKIWTSKQEFYNVFNVFTENLVEFSYNYNEAKLLHVLEYEDQPNIEVLKLELKSRGEGSLLYDCEYKQDTCLNKEKVEYADNKPKLFEREFSCNSSISKSKEVYDYTFKYNG